MKCGLVGEGMYILLILLFILLDESLGNLKSFDF